MWLSILVRFSCDEFSYGGMANSMCCYSTFLQKSGEALIMPGLNAETIFMDEQIFLFLVSKLGSYVFHKNVH